MDKHQVRGAPSGKSFEGALQILWCSLCMVAVSGLQYSWTLFVLPMKEVHGWSVGDIQIGYALFINFQAWPFFLYGLLVDRYKPRTMMAFGGFIAGAAWFINSKADTLGMLYTGEILAGIGSGIVVSSAYGNALKRFQKRRGIAVGVVSAGYGFGAAFTFWFAQHVIESVGYQTAFSVIGIGQGVAVMLVAIFLLSDTGIDRNDVPRISFRGTVSQAIAVARTPAFILMYVMFVLVAAGGVMVSAQLAPIAKDIGVSSKEVTMIGITMSALVWAGTLDRMTNGISRPFFGWVSDYIGREITLFIAFMIEGVSVFFLVKYAHDPLLFVLLSGLVFFAWGEIFSLFPSLCTDIFGEEKAATNYGLLYTAKGMASFFVPLSSVLAAGGQWHIPLYLVAVFDISAALLALVLLHHRWKKRVATV